jgi:hypothetical protein
MDTVSKSGRKFLIDSTSPPLSLSFVHVQLDLNLLQSSLTRSSLTWGPCDPGTEPAIQPIKG